MRHTHLHFTYFTYLLTYIVRRTNTAAALEFLRTTAFNSARTGVSRIAIVITNGNSMDAAETHLQADLTRRTGINLMVVAVGSWLNINELKGIVSYPSDRNTLQVDNYESFGSVVHTLRQSICGSRYITRTCMHNAKSIGLFSLHALTRVPRERSQMCPLF